MVDKMKTLWIWLYKFYVKTLTFLKGALQLRSRRRRKKERISSSALKQLIKHTFHNSKEGNKNTPIFKPLKTENVEKCLLYLLKCEQSVACGIRKYKLFIYFFFSWICLGRVVNCEEKKTDFCVDNLGKTLFLQLWVANRNFRFFF